MKYVYNTFSRLLMRIWRIVVGILFFVISSVDKMKH